MEVVDLDRDFMKVTVNEFRKGLKRYLKEREVEVMLYNKVIGVYRSCTTSSEKVVQEAILSKNVVQDKKVAIGEEFKKLCRLVGTKEAEKIYESKQS